MNCFLKIYSGLTMTHTCGSAVLVSSATLSLRSSHKLFHILVLELRVSYLGLEFEIIILLLKDIVPFTQEVIEYEQNSNSGGRCLV